MMASKCLIEKGRWMLPQQCMIGKVNYKFAVIGYSYDPTDGSYIGGSASDQSMLGNTMANGIGWQSIEVNKIDTIEMKHRNDADIVRSGKEITITKFMNRILGLPVDSQNYLFDYFMEAVDAAIETAKRLNKYDLGIMGK